MLERNKALQMLCTYFLQYSQSYCPCCHVLGCSFHRSLNFIFLHFFHNLQRIPPKFVKHLPIELPDQAILKGPSGEKWHVKLCKTVDGIYLKDGWQQFFRDHSLGDNEWLLFRYNGDLCFNVHIFGKNGCERVDASSTKANHETASSSGKRPRGRPRKTPLGLVPLHESKPCKVILGMHSQILL